MLLKNNIVIIQYNVKLDINLHINLHIKLIMLTRSTVKVASFIGMLFCLCLLLSCATKVGKELFVDEAKHRFYLPKSFPYKDSYLPSGQYRCYYYDDEGKYFEGPSSLNEEMMFSRGNTGGIYIFDGFPMKAHVYVQDKHPGYTYAEGVGVIPFGGKGYYMVRDLLPNSVTTLINIQKGEISEN